MLRILFAILIFGIASLPAAQPDVPIPANQPVIIPARVLSAEEEAVRSARTHYGIGILRARAERLATATKLFEIAAKQDPNAIAPHRELVLLYASLGRDPAAIRAARTVLARDPDDAEIARTLGKMLFEAKQFADAAKAFRLAADSPRVKNQPAVRFAALRDAGRAFQQANLGASAERAIGDAIALLRSDSATLTLPGGYTKQELARFRAELYEQLGDVHIQQKNWDRASAAFETARTLFAEPSAANDASRALRIHWNLCQLAFARDDAEAAKKHLESYLALKPNNMEPYERWVEVMKKLNRAGEVVPALAKFAGDNPTNIAISWLLCAELMPINSAQAHDNFTKLTRKYDSADGFRVLVAAYARNKKPKELLEILELLVKDASVPLLPKKQDPDEEANPGAAPPPQAVARLRALTLAIRVNQPMGLQLVQEVALSLGNNAMPSSAVLEIITAIAMREGQGAALIAGLKNALRGNATKETYFHLFALLRQQRQWRELATIAKQARLSQAFVNQLGPYYSEATAQAELGNARAALEAVDYVINNVVADGKLSSKLEKVHLLNVLGQFQEALAQCADIRLEHKSASAERRILLQEAQSWNSLKQHDKAEAALRKLLDEDPDDVLVLNNLGYNLADQGRKLDEAEKLIRRAIELDQFQRWKLGTPEAESGVYLDSLGWVQLRQGKHKEALATLEKTVLLPDSATDPTVWDHLGDVRFRLGDQPGANSAWSKAAEFYKDSHYGRQGGRLDDVKRKLKLSE